MIHGPHMPDRTEMSIVVMDFAPSRRHCPYICGFMGRIQDPYLLDDVPHVSYRELNI
jgi:hypothetical protein